MASSGRLSWQHLKPFGVEIEVDLSEPLGEVEQKALRDLYYEHEVLVFHGQRLSHPRQVEIMEILAPVVKGHEGMHFVAAEKEKGVLGRNELPFHSDFAFMPTPRPALSLHAIEVVDGATSTRFVSGTRAAAQLTLALRARLEGRTALQVFPGVGYNKTNFADLKAWVPRYAHPVLMPHPVTGRPILYVNELQTAWIEGLPQEESQALLAELFELLYAPTNVYEHFWRNGDLLIWDNTATQHARGAVIEGGPRTLQKVQCGEKTFEEMWPMSPELKTAVQATIDG